MEDVSITLETLPLEVWGITYLCSHGCYHIGVNNRLSYEVQQDVIEHELYHIKNDLCRYNRIVGFDMQHTRIEKEASPSLFFGA